MNTNNLIVRNANIVTPNLVIENGSLIIENGRIKDICHHLQSEIDNYPSIDANNNYLIPGIIDIHTDAMDLEICPRPSADFPIATAFRELERRMCGCGYTTVYHSIHLGSRMYEKEIRSKYSRMRIFEEVYSASQKNALIKAKIHLRYEITGIEEYQQAIELIQKGYVDLFSFMDHTPSEELLQNEEKLKAFAKRKRQSEDQAKTYIEEELKRPKLSKELIVELISILKNKNIAIASHDDDLPEQVNENYAMGIDLCEFPINMETARRATELGMWVIGGASNVLRGGSNIGNLSVEEAISKRVINVLCSDYYPPAILHSIFKLFSNNIVTLPEAVNLASLNAAKAARISDKTGSIEIGKQADFLIVNYSNLFASLLYTVVDGNVSGEFKTNKSRIYEFSV